MKHLFIFMTVFSILSCNNSAEDVIISADSTQMGAVDTALSKPIVIVPSTKERILQGLKRFEPSEVDSTDSEDLLETIKDILEAINEESENHDWKNANEYVENTESTLKQTTAGTDIFNKNQSEFDKIKNKIEKHRLEDVEAEKYLKKISSNRWEKIRHTFQGKLNRNELTHFTSEQLDDYKQILADWTDYKETNKLSWYLNHERNLEDLFFNYSKDNDKVKAAWGFMLQECDWEGAVAYFTKIAPDATATGKPYYMLKYYYNTIGKDGAIEELYDHPTDKYVGELCPQDH